MYELTGEQEVERAQALLAASGFHATPVAGRHTLAHRWLAIRHRDDEAEEVDKIVRKIDRYANKR